MMSHDVCGVCLNLLSHLCLTDLWAVEVGQSED
jgi:hypothetical protein